MATQNVDKSVSWSIVDDWHASGAIEAFEVEGGIPVLVAYVGRYPKAVSDDGRSTRDVPHVLIQIAGGFAGATRYYTGVIVTAVGAWEGSTRQELVVFTDTGYDESRRQQDPSEWVRLGKEKLAEGVSVLVGMRSSYAAAAAVIAPAMAYDAPLSRAEYESACAACGVPALSDEECTGYGVRYGAFSFPEYPALHVAKMRLASLHLAQLDAEAAAAAARPVAPPAVPVQQGQLWEPCELCGADPVYMPLHLCAKCWPTK